MGFRISKQVKLAGAIILAAVGIGFVAKHFHGAWQSGEDGAKVWFYDQSERRLYAAARDTVPPDKGVGGPSGDGVRAVVVAFPGEQNDPRKRRIAYLETHTPALKELLDRARAAHASGRPVTQPVPPRESAFFRTNTLVKRVEEAQWYPSDSNEGRMVMSEWRSWRGSGGQLPVVCVP